MAYVTRRRKQARTQREDNDSPGSSSAQCSKPPPIMTAACTVKKLFTYEVPFSIKSYLGFSNDGVLVEQLGGNKLMKLKLQMGSSPSYKRAWQKAVPEDVEGFGKRFMLDDGRIIMSNRTTVISPEYDITYQSITFGFSSTLQLIDEFIGDFGYLCGIISPDMLLYSKNIDNKFLKYELDIYRASDHDHVHTLSEMSSGCVSVCKHDKSQWIAIVGSHMMDIYKSDFTHHRRVELTYEPCGDNAAAAVKDYIIVATLRSPGELHMYSWDGVWLMHMGVGGKVQGIGCGRKGQIQVQKYHVDEYLHVYEIT